MNKIVLYNQNGQNFDVDVVRYFESNGNNYLIFNLNEIDTNGYIQLYLAKLSNKDGKQVMVNVSDENEWNEFRNTIQKIVTNNRNKVANLGTLDYKQLDGMMVSEFRVFKLKKEVTDMLSINSDIVTENDEPSVPKEPVNLQAASAQDTGLTIEQILKKVSEGAKSAREVNKIDLNETKPALTIEDLIKNEEKKETIPAPVEHMNIEVPNVAIEMPEELPQTPKPKIISDILPTKKINLKSNSEVDYKSKYNQSLKTIHDLEEENMNLINELVEAKAIIATIRDIIK